MSHIISFLTDDENPIITGCNDVTITVAPGNTTVPAYWNPPTATDNSGDVNVTGSATPGDEFPVGTSSIAYLAVDASNNQATCAVNIIVRGKTYFDFVFVSYKRQFTESTCNNVMKLFTSAM